MHQNYARICRVCMKEGSREIFPNHGQAAATTTPSSALDQHEPAPLDRLLEKLRYVTMMKIEENDDLPTYLCDLCIVQLNVAYHFKRQAVENDTKLRQYFIENGISWSQQSSVENSDVSSPRNILQSPTLPQTAAQKNFPIMPFVVKTEMIDNQSDYTVDTTSQNMSNSCSSSQINLPNYVEISDSHQVEHCSPILNTDSRMVYVNSMTPFSEIECNELHASSKESGTVNKNANCSTTIQSGSEPSSSSIIQSQKKTCENSELKNLSITMNFSPSSNCRRSLRERGSSSLTDIRQRKKVRFMKCTKKLLHKDGNDINMKKKPDESNRSIKKLPAIKKDRQSVSGVRRTLLLNSL